MDGLIVRVLVGCETSGVVRRAFRAQGHEAWSCDLLPADDGDPHHIEGDVRTVLRDGWDVGIFFPPCTDLAVSGARWFAEKRADGRQQASIRFFIDLVTADIPRVAVENPVGIMSTHYRKPDQIIQPWQFGHGETKATCLWLKGLPLLQATNVVAGRVPRVHYESPGPDRWKRRSVTYAGIAEAMAAQLGGPRD